MNSKIVYKAQGVAPGYDAKPRWGFLGIPQGLIPSSCVVFYEGHLLFLQRLMYVSKKEK